MGSVGKAISDPAGTAIDVVREVSGAADQARAAERAALAKQRAAKRRTQFLRESREEALDLIDSPEEIKALERDIEQREIQQRRQEELLRAIRPQALAALRGETTRFTQPIQEQQDAILAQRERSRQDLINQLRQRGIDPGSSAGRRALQEFDQETQLQSARLQRDFAQQRQQALGALLGGTRNLESDISSNLGQQRTSGLAFGDIARRKANIFTQGSRGIGRSLAGEIGTAGASQVGEQIAAAQRQQLFNQAIKAGASAIGGGAGGSSGGGAASNASIANIQTTQNQSPFGASIRRGP